MTYVTEIAQVADVLDANNLQHISFSQNICLDGALASMYFDEFIDNASGCHDVQKFDDYLVIYGSNAKKTDKYFKKSQLTKMRKPELIDLCNMLDVWYWDSDTKSEIIDELMRVDNEDYYKAHYQATDYHDLDYDFSFSGYRQRDNYKVKTVGKVEPWLDSDYLTHIFYDAPLTGTIEVTINGVVVNDISICEFMDDEYACWDKSTFIEKCAKYVSNLDYKDLLIEFLKDELRESVEYHD